MENGCSFCEGHGAKLHDGLARRGIARFARRLGGTPAVRDDGATCDPLELAETAIYAGAVKQLGLRAWWANPEGTDRCYLCERDRRLRSGTGERFAENVLSAVAEYMRREGFLALPRVREFSLVTGG